MALKTRINPNNMFARVATFSALDEAYECHMSPENLYADGERSREQANALAKRLQADYQERRNELIFA
jgi:hypothetical protein